MQTMQRRKAPGRSVGSAHAGRVRVEVLSLARLDGLWGGLQYVPLLENGLAGPNGAGGGHDKRSRQDFGVSQPVPGGVAVGPRHPSFSKTDCRFALSRLPRVRNK